MFSRNEIEKVNVVKINKKKLFLIYFSSPCLFSNRIRKAFRINTINNRWQAHTTHLKDGAGLLFLQKHFFVLIDHKVNFRSKQKVCFSLDFSFCNLFLHEMTIRSNVSFEIRRAFSYFAALNYFFLFYLWLKFGKQFKFWRRVSVAMQQQIKFNLDT